MQESKLKGHLITCKQVQSPLYAKSDLALFQVYTYCYDARYTPSENCRPRSYNDLITSAERPHSASYGLFDGRGNVNVGKGRFYRRGRDLVVECEFPRQDRLVSSVVWYRKAAVQSSEYGGGSSSFDYPDRRRLRVDNIGRHGSRLVLRDYDALSDDGVYRCFTTRSRDHGLTDSYGHAAKETVFMEIDVYSHARKNNYNNNNWVWDGRRRR